MCYDKILIRQTHCSRNDYECVPRIDAVKIFEGLLRLKQKKGKNLVEKCICLLPVADICKAFRYHLWSQCLLSRLFHPKNVTL